MPDRFYRVNKKLYRGGKPTDHDLKHFRKNLGINRIVSLDQESGEEIQPICDALGLDQMIWGIGGGNDPKIDVLKNKIIPYLQFGGPTYVHCKHGKDRTGMTIAMFKILQGMQLRDALEEAKQIGMGKGLKLRNAKEYYNAVIKFYKELINKQDNDINNNSDIVSLTRKNDLSLLDTPAINDSSITNGYINSTGPLGVDIEFSQLSRIAASPNRKVYRKCNYKDLLKPNKYWFFSIDNANRYCESVSGDELSLYSADLPESYGINICHFEDKRIDNNLYNKILLDNNDVDCAIFKNGIILIINPINSLINIVEEDDDVNDIVEVGVRDTSTNYTFSFPGSGSGIGGMPPNASGFPILPYTGSGQV